MAALTINLCSLYRWVISIMPGLLYRCRKKFSGIQWMLIVF